MTYNFDPERWYENERSFLDRQRRSEGWSEAEWEAALADLERRYNQMVERLDGTYHIPDSSGRREPASGR